MKLLIALSLVLPLLAFANDKECADEGDLGKQAQALAKVSATIEDCPEPTKDQINLICTNISDRSKDPDQESDFIFLYEKSLWKMSCAHPGKDTEDVAKIKIKKMWDKFFTKFECDTTGLRHGNILKYSIHSNFVEFIQNLASTYQLNINFKDPNDGKTVLDYTKDEIEKLKSKQVNNKAQIVELESIYKILKNELGAKLSSEI